VAIEVPAARNPCRDLGEENANASSCGKSLRSAEILGQSRTRTGEARDVTSAGGGDDRSCAGLEGILVRVRTQKAMLYTLRPAGVLVR
jgi:hypothetical protein